MRPAIKSLTLVVILLMYSSCASIVSKKNWPVAIGTTPSGAKVSITNKKGVEVYNGTTPSTMTLKSGAGFFVKESYVVKISMAGYDEKIIPLECKVNGWYWGNIIFGGFIGLLIVDPATGAMYKLSTNILHTNLSMTSASATPSLRIMNIDQIPQHWHEHLVSIK